jgi:hypothetical protein
MAAAPNLVLKAGPRAREILQDEGLSLDRIRVLAGASGGPKWLVLSGMDMALAPLLKERDKELVCIGSSIGSWRIAALAQQDNESAVKALEEQYIGQSYYGRPSAREVTVESRRIGAAYIADDDIPFMLHHPVMKIAFLAARSRWPGAHDAVAAQATHLTAAFAANLVSRPLLGLFFERTLFHAPGFPTDIIGADAFPPHPVQLTERNLRDAVLASGSIPLVMEGMNDLPDTPPGTYRDGGVIDYHMNLPFAVEDDELVFMPHFFEHVTPGWFDKNLPWRRAATRGMENTVLVAPSPEFIASLPGAKVPDRADFQTFVNRDDERMALWNKVVKQCRLLGRELEELFCAPPSSITIHPLMNPEQR